jgi:hypothetical protein
MGILQLIGVHKGISVLKVTFESIRLFDDEHTCIQMYSKCWPYKTGPWVYICVSIPVGHVIKFYETQRALWTDILNWSRTNQYLYPENLYNKMIP